MGHPAACRRRWTERFPLRRRPPLALAALTALLSAAPARAQLTEADVFVAEGVIALDDKEYDKALSLFRQALERAPEHVERAVLAAGLVSQRPASAFGHGMVPN